VAEISLSCLSPTLKLGDGLDHRTVLAHQCKASPIAGQCVHPGGIWITEWMTGSEKRLSTWFICLERGLKPSCSHATTQIKKCRHTSTKSGLLFSDALLCARIRYGMQERVSNGLFHNSHPGEAVYVYPPTIYCEFRYF